MKKSINYKRVRRIKAVIYLFLLLIVLVLAMLMAVAGIRMLAPWEDDGSVSGAGSQSSSALVGSPGSGAAPDPDAATDSSRDAQPALINANPSSTESGTSRIPEPESESEPESAPEILPDDIAADDPAASEPDSLDGQPVTAGESGSDYSDVYEKIPNTGFPKPGEME